ncbi:MAG: HlyD family efflux transporter periplasmic adaptor subunit [Burkholderiales bacterium]|jgi:adhesin transport system membrane fusion protein|nr:HlyD family efflux transporter periplasmic adaptor subunit [Burkholderiales bacterium]
MKLHTHITTNRVLLVTTASFGVWAGFFNINQSAQAQGQVIAAKKTQYVQVADGGVLTALHVREGQKVENGQLLAVLSQKRANALVDELQDQLSILRIAKIRASAELSGIEADFSKEEATHPLEVIPQRRLFQQNRRLQKAEVDGYLAALVLAKEEVEQSARLYENGDIGKSELMRVQRQVIDLEQRMNSGIESRRSEAGKELARIHSDIASLENRLREKMDILSFTHIRAPESGLVRDLKNGTTGAVFRPGEELLQITPSESELIIEGKLVPTEVSLVKKGQTANLNFDTFDYGRFGQLKGTVSYISPDTLMEQGPNGNSYNYYRIKISIDKEQTNKRIDLTKLQTGMVVSADIQTGERTLLSYLAGPVGKSLSRSLGEK